METNFVVAQNDFYGSPLTNQRPIVANLNNDLQKNARSSLACRRIRSNCCNTSVFYYDQSGSTARP